MKAILKFIDWTHENPYEYNPIEQSDVCITFTCAIGPEDEDGVDFFYITVCSFEYLFSHNEFENKILRHILLIKKYNFDNILSIINTYISNCNGNNWDEISLKLARYFQWEYEGYVNVE